MTIHILKKRHWILVSLLAVMGISVPGASRASVIDFAGNGSTVLYWGPGGAGGNQTYAEIFTALDSLLLNYSLNVYSLGGTFPFVSEIYRWDGSQIVGPAFYESAVQNTTNSLTTYTFNPNVGLIAGQQYLALVSNQPHGASLGGSGSGLMELSDAPVSGSGFRWSYSPPGANTWRSLVR